jgi:putative PIN family toxin of toxin-antitoxin system
MGAKEKVKGTFRVVLDTNVVLSALLFTSGRLAWLRTSWQTGDVQPLASHDTVTELIRVLAYPKFKLTAVDREELLTDYLPFTETVHIPKDPPAMPLCRDPFDLPFLHLALVGKADALITGDADLMALASRITVPILTPESLREKFPGNG